MGGSARVLEGIDGKIELNVKKWSFYQDFIRKFFQVVPDTSQHKSLFTFSDQIHPLKSRKAPKTLKKLFPEDFVTISDRQEKFGGMYMALAAYST